MKQIANFINSIFFIILVNAIAVLFWYLEKPMIAYIIYLVFCVVIILTKANRVAIASIIISGIIGYQVDDGNYIEFHSVYAKIFIPLGIIVILLFIVDIIRSKTKFRFSHIFFAFLGILIVNILSFINVRGEDLAFVALLGVLQLTGYLIIYAYLLNTHDENGKKYISNIALITATSITIQLAIHYLTLGSVSNKGDNDLSWAVSNSIAMFYLVLIPIGLYNYFRDQRNFIVLLITGFNFVMTLFMLSRGAYLSIAIILIPSVILMTWLARDKKRLFIDVIATFLICLLIS